LRRAVAHPLLPSQPSAPPAERGPRGGRGQGRPLRRQLPPVLLPAISARAAAHSLTSWSRDSPSSSNRSCACHMIAPATTAMLSAVVAPHAYCQCHGQCCEELGVWCAPVPRDPSVERFRVRSLDTHTHSRHTHTLLVLEGEGVGLNANTARWGMGRDGGERWWEREGGGEMVGEMGR